MAKVTVNHIYKIYPGEKGTNVTAVEDVNLEIADREFVVLVGPSGCGKSTTLRMIAGLEEISRGDIYIGDRRVNDVAPKDRDIAMVFQNYALYPHMNVFDNMAFGLRLRKYGKTEIKKRVNDAASIFDVSFGWTSILNSSLPVFSTLVVNSAFDGVTLMPLTEKSFATFTVIAFGLGSSPFCQKTKFGVTSSACGITAFNVSTVVACLGSGLSVSTVTVFV